jgi:hypothetical protein
VVVFRVVEEVPEYGYSCWVVVVEVAAPVVGVAGVTLVVQLERASAVKVPARAMSEFNFVFMVGFG